MEVLPGKISDRIRSGQVPADAVDPRAADRQQAENVRTGSGKGLGTGATRSRSGS